MQLFPDLQMENQRFRQNRQGEIGWFDKGYFCVGCIPVSGAADGKLTGFLARFCYHNFWEGMVMKPFWKDFITAGLMGFVLPAVIFHVAGKGMNRPAPPNPPVTESTFSAQPEGDSLTVQLLTAGGEVKERDLEEYLTGVVLAEMPASFETEALKAQSVVARTYTLKVMETGVKHDGAVCTDHTCCQAYMDPMEYTGGAENLEKVRTAVLATAGQVLTYEGELIEATYFSCSGGSTEDAVAVWGTDYPYLRATESPGEEDAVHFTDTAVFSAAEFADRLGISDLGNPSDWIGYATYTAGGGVNSILLGGREFKGTEVRTLLGLRSTAFSIRVEGQSICVTTKGFGHRVGMSQYGADAMALDGKTYGDILAHYYQGTTLENIGN
jgi:stage II sporulation protein D